MSHSGFILIVIFAIIISNFVENSTAIKCWTCSSDAVSASFCNDPFDDSKITDEQKRLSYSECPNPTSSNQKSVCKKLKELINDKYVIQRSCFRVNSTATGSECLNKNMPIVSKTECVICDKGDGCNDAAKYRPVALFVAIVAVTITVKNFIFL